MLNQTCGLSAHFILAGKVIASIINPQKKLLVRNYPKLEKF